MRRPYSLVSGSSTSRTASPIRLNASTVMVIAAPAVMIGQDEPNRLLSPSRMMLPQLGFGGWVPSPRKLSEASSRIAEAINKGFAAPEPAASAENAGLVCDFNRVVRLKDFIRSPILLYRFKINVDDVLLSCAFLPVNPDRRQLRIFARTTRHTQRFAQRELIAQHDLPRRNHAAGNVNRFGFGHQNQIARTDDRVNRSRFQVGDSYDLKRNSSAGDGQRLRFFARTRTKQRFGVQYLNRAGCFFGDSTRRGDQFVEPDLAFGRYFPGLSHCAGNRRWLPAFALDDADTHLGVFYQPDIRTSNIFLYFSLRPALGRNRIDKRQRAQIPFTVDGCRRTQVGLAKDFDFEDVAWSKNVRLLL